MTRAGLVLANLFRKPARTLLTLLAVTTAFLLFGLLQSVNNVFSSGVDFVGATRLVTQARVSFAQPLPLRLITQIEAVPGVARVAHMQWFGGQWQNNTPLFVLAVDPQRHHDVYPEWVMPEAQWQQFAATRTGMIVGKPIADKYGWSVGQKIPISSTIYPQKGGSKEWAFDLVGIYDGKDETWKKQANTVFINFDYFDEANQFSRGLTSFFVVELGDGANAGQIGRAIDALFANSPDETKTQTEKDFNLGFIKQIGDIGLIVRWILFAVFFTLLFVVGNTMSQSVRERQAEWAVLKTLGFSDNSVLGIVLAESVLMCAAGGLAGLALATGLGSLLGSGSGGLALSVDASVWLLGVAAMLLMSLVVALVPALRARRLRIVDALASR